MRLTRTSCSAAVAPSSSAIKPSQRRSFPSRVTRRSPMARSRPSSVSTTMVIDRRAESSVGPLTTADNRSPLALSVSKCGRGVRDISSFDRLRTNGVWVAALQRLPASPPTAAFTSSPSAAAKARSYPGCTVILSMALTPSDLDKARSSAARSDTKAARSARARERTFCASSRRPC